MNGIISEIEMRRAKRALDEREIPGEVLGRILNAARIAPSCFNNQPWRLVVVNGQETLNKLKEHLSDGNYWAKRSPCIIGAATEAELDCKLSDKREYALFDTGLAVENMVLQAFREGLIAHPIAGFKPVPIKELLGIPEQYILITLVILGYPGDISVLSEKHQQSELSGRERKPENEVIAFNGWSFT